MAVGAEHLAEQRFEPGFLENQARERASSIRVPLRRKLAVTLSVPQSEWLHRRRSEV